MDTSKLDFLIDTACLKVEKLLREDISELEIIIESLEASMWLSIALTWFETNTPKLLYNDPLVYIAKTKKREKEKKSKSGSYKTHFIKSDLKENYYKLLGVKQIFNTLKHNMGLDSLATISYSEYRYSEFLETKANTPVRDIKIKNIKWVHSKETKKRNSLQYKSFSDNYSEHSIRISLAYAKSILLILKSEIITN